MGTFRDEVQALLKGVPADRPIEPSDVAKWCARSIVPDSRAAIHLAEIAGSARSQARSRSGSGGEIVIFGPLKLLDGLLESSIPSGLGGAYPEAPGSRFADRVLTVWYMHIDDGGLLTPYFENPAAFRPYRLPPDGRLERNAYPFLLFEDAGATLRLGGLGSEWFGALTQLNQLQFQ